MLDQLKALKHLDLDTSQKESVQAVIEGSREKVVRLAGVLAEAHVALEDAVGSRSSTEALRARAEAVGVALGELAVLRVELQAAVSACLTPEQVQRIEALMRQEQDERAQQREGLRNALADGSGASEGLLSLVGLFTSPTKNRRAES
jgi:Spy/CpxP family protein refolding chaperone